MSLTANNQPVNQPAVDPFLPRASWSSYGPLLYPTLIGHAHIPFLALVSFSYALDHGTPHQEKDVFMCAPGTFEGVKVEIIERELMRRALEASVSMPQ